MEIIDAYYFWPLGAREERGGGSRIAIPRPANVSRPSDGDRPVGGGYRPVNRSQAGRGVSGEDDRSAGRGESGGWTGLCLPPPAASRSGCAKPRRAKAGRAGSNSTYSRAQYWCLEQICVETRVGFPSPPMRSAPVRRGGRARCSLRPSPSPTPVQRFERRRDHWRGRRREKRKEAGEGEASVGPTRVQRAHDASGGKLVFSGVGISTVAGASVQRPAGKRRREASGGCGKYSSIGGWTPPPTCIWSRAGAPVPQELEACRWRTQPPSHFCLRNGGGNEVRTGLEIPPKAQPPGRFPLSPAGQGSLLTS